jgi:hypothetical protein
MAEKAQRRTAAEEKKARAACGCNFGTECNGLGVLYCEDSPVGGCGGDLCICGCGGERECSGCEWCDNG